MVKQSVWKSSLPILQVAMIICLFWSVTALQSAAASDLENGVTVNTLLEVSANTVDDNTEIRLIDFADTLSLIWRLNSSSWFPIWEILLTSPGTNDVNLGTSIPAPGHAYDVKLSYHPESGAIGIALTDTTTNLSIATYAATIATDLTLSQPQTDGQLIAVNPQYEPIGIKWEVGFLEGATFLSSTVLEPDLPAQVRLTAPNPVDGEYRIVMVKNGVEHLLAATAAVTTTAPLVINLPVAGLPLGSSTFMLLYYRNNSVKELSRRQITIGKLQGVAHTLATDFDQHQLNLDLVLDTDSKLTDLALTLQARLYPLEWRTELKSYVDGEPIVYELPITYAGTINHQQVVPISLPMPERNALWRAEVRLKAEPDILVNYALINPYFTTGDTGKQLPDGRRAIRIGTYNILGFQGYPEDEAKKQLGGQYDLTRIEHFMQVIKDLQTDILCLQEGATTFQLADYASRLGVNVATFPTTTSYPGGILTQFPIIETRPFRVPRTTGVVPFSRHGGAALLDVAGVPLWAVSLHAYPHDEAVRIQEAVILGNTIDELLEVSPYIIVCGDFNERTQGSLHQALRERGFINALEIIGPMQPIDHIYVSPILAGHIRAGWIVTDNGYRLSMAGTRTWANSDHIPVLMELALP
jgi:endonuclease/exonuclease/phosphatase family metal-dependent hydrolase